MSFSFLYAFLMRVLPRNSPKIELRCQCTFNPKTAANRAKKNPARSDVPLRRNRPPIIVGIRLMNLSLYAISNGNIIFILCFRLASSETHVTKNIIRVYTRNLNYY